MGDENSSPKAKAMKSVSIAESDRISPLIIGNHKDVGTFEEPLDLDRTPGSRQYTTSLSTRRLQGRPSFERSSSRASVEPPLAPILDEYFGNLSSSSRPQSSHGGHSHSLVKQISSWVKHEKRRRDERRAARKARKANTGSNISTQEPHEHDPARRGSDSSEGSIALENLTAILKQAVLAEQSNSYSRKNSVNPFHRKSGSFSRMRRKSSAISSDTEYSDVDLLVPSAEVVLDNSKTLSYSGGEADSSDPRRASTATMKAREQEAWATFKSEIVRLTHTLRLKGWRRVPRDLSNEIEVTRLSGALTNAVYVVSPPKNLPQPGARDGDKNPRPLARQPPKLLLRIYGPQVEHLIDRESELQILRRLARKKIGPRMLGTFVNGRFEEFLHAETLTPRDLRVPETSRQIAKRMRELHEGIDLLPKERDEGPFVWKNWDKWVDRCEQIVTWLDNEVNAHQANASDVQKKRDDWKNKGYVCGAEWPTFKKVVDKYRAWLDAQYGGSEKLKERLIFAHNDTQYGNILRMVPASESPLLLPANVHKQLVVIDFEYANANVPGLEFANHFTEWCYNYHDEKAPHACNTSGYPTSQEQHRFIRAYVLHRPAYSSVSSPPTPQLSAISPSAGQSMSSSISTFMLDSRGPPSPESMRARTTKDRTLLEEARREDQENEAKTEEEIQRILAETRVWRLANSAQWVAWGVVQAKVPNMPELKLPKRAPEVVLDEVSEEDASTLDGSEGVQSILAKVEKTNSEADGKLVDGDVEGETEEADGEAEEEEEEFDYLAYAQDRALFFWGDAVALGIVELDELPESIRSQVKFVNY